MFFVYPGKSGMPEISLRLKQLMYGNKDYSFLRYCESKLGRDFVVGLVKELTGNVEDLKYDSETRKLVGGYKDDYNLLESIKKKLAVKLEKL
ncbi:glycoside hydrolase domain-containing protein [uncultured Finegoldia sp.]|uniref:glycoside hydrolase domain-containing protein n=1 Tax=uncultured Finegoldia sp. TaxID=328009 RepID=UPI00260F5F9E|nr:glycoside hydrolase domain-containing protein [uncultured Finegoldia sp.]